MCIIHLYIQKLHFLPMHCICVFYMIILLHSIYQLIFVKEMQSHFFDVGSEFLNSV